jgi:putative addiction module antidote
MQTDYQEVEVLREVVVRRMGGSVGVTLPKETAEEMKVAAGDRVLIVETERGILIMKHDQAFADAMKAYEEGAREYRNALRELAKS